MILQATARAIQEVLQLCIDDAVGEDVVPVLLADEQETKPPLPHIVIDATECEEEITPGSGIFRVSGNIVFSSHTKATDPAERERVLDAINNFAYDTTATKLSQIDGFHCHGWEPLGGNQTADNERKAVVYTMKYRVHCMQMDN